MRIEERGLSGFEIPWKIYQIHQGFYVVDATTAMRFPGDFTPILHPSDRVQDH